MTFSVEGKTAVVTGAADGIGLAVARHFVKQGAKVMFADSDAQSLKAEFEMSPSPNKRYFAGELQDRLTHRNLLAAALDEFERVDILVNASRKVSPTGEELKGGETLNSMLDHNLRQHYILSRLFAKRFIDQSTATNSTGGAIVNITSIAARRTRPELLDYSISRAALDQCTRALALALAKHHIRVNAVAFGSVMSAKLKAKIANSSEIRSRIIASTPLGRIADASEIAGAVQFLSSDASKFITGQIISVDGGRTLMDSVEVPIH